MVIFTLHDFFDYIFLQPLPLLRSLVVHEFRPQILYLLPSDLRQPLPFGH